LKNNNRQNVVQDFFTDLARLIIPALKQERLLSRHDRRLTTPDKTACFLGGDQRSLL
jgi:hypothetical protein